jgi:hypothetical protein
MMRKHFLTQKVKIMKNFPFYSWECITILLPQRQVNLIIRDQKSMNALLQFLIFRLKTIDGQKNSGIKVIEELVRQKVKELGKEPSSSELQEIELKIRHQLARQVFSKYNIMRIRHKISYHAMLK